MTLSLYINLIPPVPSTFSYLISFKFPTTTTIHFSSPNTTIHPTNNHVFEKKYHLLLQPICSHLQPNIVTIYLHLLFNHQPKLRMIPFDFQFPPFFVTLSSNSSMSSSSSSGSLISQHQNCSPSFL